jgi:PST family polysaccharide transporter
VFISVTAALVLAWAGCGYWALVAKWVLHPFIVTAGAWIVCGWRPGPPSRKAGVGPLLRFALHTYGNFVMSYFRRNIDKILIGRFFGTQSLGYYDRAYHLSNMLPVQLLTPLNSVSLAAFSRLNDKHEQYRASYLKVVSVLAFIGMPLSAALTLVSHDVIFLLLGSRWDEAGPIFLAFGPSIGIAVIYITHGWLHLSLGTPDRWFRWSIIEFIVTVLCFLAGFVFGTLGVAVAFSASFYILIGPALRYAGKPVKLTFSSVFLVLWRYYAAALAAGTACWIAFRLHGQTAAVFASMHTLSRIATAAVSCISLYLLLVVVLHKSTRPIADFFSVLREMLLKKTGDSGGLPRAGT